MQKVFKRTLSVFLAVVMIVTVFTAASISVSAADVNGGSIALGETQTATIVNGGDIVFYEFTPTENMTVKFYSSSESDTYGYIYGANKETLIKENDDGGEGSNFKIVCDLTANKTYYFGARFYGNGTSGSFNVTLEQLTTKTICFVSNDVDQGSVNVVDPSEINPYELDIPVPDNGEEGKAFLGYYNGDTLIFSYNGSSFSYNNHLSSSDFTNDELTLTAKWADAPVFLGETVSLDSVIRLNLYFDAKEYWVYGASAGDLDTDVHKEGTERLYNMYCSYVEVDGRSHIYKISVDVYAKEMADNIKVEVSYSNGNNYASVSKTASVKDYLETLATNAETYAPAGKVDELRDLCYATLNYGAAAQKQFGHYGDYGDSDSGYNIPLANENVPASYTPNAVPSNLAVDSGSQEDFSDYKMEYYASSLGLFSDTGYAICFEDMDEDYNTSVSVYNGNEECDSSTVGRATYTTTDEYGYEQTTEHNMIAYNIRGIAAKDLLDDIEITFSGYVSGHYENDNWVDGYDLPEKTFTFSPRTYIVKVLTQAGVDPDYDYGDLDPEYGGGSYSSKEQQTMANLVVTVRAIYDYSTRASAYFD